VFYREAPSNRAIGWDQFEPVLDKLAVVFYSTKKIRLFQKEEL